MSESYRVVPTRTEQSYRVSESYRPYRADSLSHSSRYESYPESGSKAKPRQPELFEARQRLILARRRRPGTAAGFRREIEALVSFYRDRRPKAGQNEEESCKQ